MVVNAHACRERFLDFVFSFIVFLSYNLIGFVLSTVAATMYKIVGILRVKKRCGFISIGNALLTWLPLDLESAWSL